MKQDISITVKGKQHDWTFTFKADPAHLAEWRADGLEVHVIECRVPFWMAGTPLAPLWCGLQGIWRWMRLW